MTAATVEPMDPRLERARNGDLASFNELVLENQDVVFRLCRRMLKDEAAAEDATQETFIACWKNIRNLRGALRPWLLTVAANVCRSEMRRPRYRRSSSLDLALESGMPEPAEAAQQPEAITLNAALKDRIQDALSRLPEDQRLALTLRDVEGLDYLEIAAATNTTMGTVKSRIARARTRMRELLAADAPRPAAATAG